MDKLDIIRVIVLSLIHIFLMIIIIIIRLNKILKNCLFLAELTQNSRIILIIHGIFSILINKIIIIIFRPSYFFKEREHYK
jgi:hypothetical protein